MELWKKQNFCVFACVFALSWRSRHESKHIGFGRGRLGRMVLRVEKVSAITFRVTNMQVSVQFYRDLLGMELIYGGEDSYFSSLRSSDADSAILNLEKGHPGSRWGRLILYVTDVDGFWTHLKENGFDPETPKNGAWGERYFHMPDPDGHELSFARPLR